ncbi:jacalin-related lectin 34-like [Humulus lupulus]|uniref:jacalin-related lectin 34-like n=1 Tax=Humulus lupulus TaxID=3486 RepID=UPI002B404608|nr:jacalin-related lectin 34-like [Humulus lupulus]
MGSSEGVISLGAWGSRSGGVPWSYKPSSGITEITIHEAGIIKSISFKDAAGLFSGTFGGGSPDASERGVEKKVTINFPLEYLKSISGTYGDYKGVSDVIISLSFNTNLTTHGPFGTRSTSSGKPFSVPITDSVVVGFHGRACYYLDAIGVYVKPVNPDGSISFGKSGGLGGDNPMSFTVGNSSWITVHNDRANGQNIIDHQGSSGGVISIGESGSGSGGVPWSYKRSSGQSDITIHEGGNVNYISFKGAGGFISGTFGGGRPADASETGQEIKGSSKEITSERGEEKKVTVNWPSEHLKSISGTYGDYNGVSDVITSLSFHTNLTTHGPFGTSSTTSGKPFSSPITDSAVVGFHGRSGRYLDALGIYVKPLNTEGIISFGIWGGLGGDSPISFKVGSGSCIKQISVNHDDSNIKSLTFLDGNGRVYGKFGGKNTNDMGVEKIIEFDGRSKFLTSISGTYGSYRGITVITSLSFTTNLNTSYGPFGKETGHAFSNPIQGGVVVGFHGKSGHYIDSIGIYVKPASSSGGAISLGPWGSSSGGEPWSYKPSSGISEITIHEAGNINSISFKDAAGSVSKTFGGGNLDVVSETGEDKKGSSTGVISVGPWGSRSGGEPWNYKPTSGITEITIHEGGNIKSISFKDARGYISRTFGGGNLDASEKGVEKKKLTINWPSEYLKSISGTYGDYKGVSHVIISLFFNTNLTTHGPFGTSSTTSGKPFTIPIADSAVVGFHGRSSNYLDAIGIFVKPVNPDGIISFGIWGGLGGDSPISFKVGSGSWIKQISVGHDDSNITSLTFLDGNGRVYGKFGGKNPNDIGVEKIIEFDGRSKFLTSISGTYGIYRGLTVITSLSFITNVDTYGPFGKETGTIFSNPIQGGVVVGFHGKSGHYIDSIGIYVKPVKAA